MKRNLWKNALAEVQPGNINLSLFTLETLEENHFALIGKTFDLEDDDKLN